MKKTIYQQIIKFRGYVNEILVGNTVDGIDENTKNSIIDAVNDGKIIKTELITNEIDESSIAEEKNKIKEALEEKVKIAKYYDISVILKVDEQEIGKVRNLKTEIPIEIEIPNDLPKINDDYTRKYKIIRMHNENAEELEIISSNKGILTFRTNKFSTYALAYIDTKNEQLVSMSTPTVENTNTIEENVTTEEQKIENKNIQESNTDNPKTGDTIMRYVIIMIISIVGIYVVYRFKKSDK